MLKIIVFVVHSCVIVTKEGDAVALRVSMASKHDYYSDTSPKALAVFIELQRRRTPAQKLESMFEMTSMVLRLSEQGVRQRYPSADEHEVRMRAAALRLDRQTMIKVYGWDPAEHL